MLVTANDRATPDFDALGDRFAPPSRASVASCCPDSDPWTPTSLAAVLGDVRLDHDRLLSRIAPWRGCPRVPRSGGACGTWAARCADSTAAALYVRVRDAGSRDPRASRPTPLAASPTSAYGEMWVPWLWLPGRIARLLPASMPTAAGLDVDAIAGRAGRGRGRPGRAWGERHRFARCTPWPTSASTHAFDPAVAGQPLAATPTAWPRPARSRGADRVVAGPVARYVWDLADRDDSRWAVPLGACAVAGRPPPPRPVPLLVVRQELFPVGPPSTVTLRARGARADAPLLHAWVTQPRARFWGMASRSVEEVAAIYGWIDAQGRLTAWLVPLDGRPVGIVQTYDPFVDEIGDFYDRRR